MENLKKAVAKYAAELVMTLGAGLVSIGIGLYSGPAGLIAAGAFLLAGAVLNCIGGDKT